MLTHFPENVWDMNVASEDILKTMGGSRDEVWRRFRDLFNGKKEKWAINKFKPYKSPDQTGYSLLFFKKQSKYCRTKLPSIVLLCRSSYTLGYLRKPWRDVKVVYKPKDPEQPISLTYFLFENHEKVDRPAHKVEVPSKAPLCMKCRLPTTQVNQQYRLVII
jgi:hypothetical protein